MLPQIWGFSHESQQTVLLHFQQLTFIVTWEHGNTVWRSCDILILEKLHTDMCLMMFFSDFAVLL